MFHFESTSDLLKAEFENRKSINPRYSLRGFARFLGISPSKLSEMMNGRQGLSVEKASALAKQLNLSETETSTLRDLAASESSRSLVQRDAARSRLRELKRSKAEHLLNPVSRVTFSRISAWFHFAALEALDLAEFTATARTLADLLRISRRQAREALLLLEEQGLIQAKKGGYQRTKRNLSASFGVPSTAIRRMTAQLLAKASQAIFEQDIQERHISTLTVAIDSKRIPEVFAKIDAFRRELNLWITEGQKDRSADTVYCFTTQFFKLTQSGDRRC